jgi:hypothetical protein
MASLRSCPAVRSRLNGFLSAVVLLAGLFGLAGCATERFVASYYIDPKPPRLLSADLNKPAQPEPVYLVFDVYAGGASYSDATRKLGPKVSQVLEDSHLFSTVSKVGSENMARIQVAMKETAVLTGKEAATLPEGLTSGIAGSKGVIAYQFNLSYQPAGGSAVRKTYPHAVHYVNGTSPQLGDQMPMNASHAVNVMVEQVVLRFLRDLQKDGVIK